MLLQRPRPFLIVHLQHVPGDPAFAVRFLAQRAKQPRVKVHLWSLAFREMPVVPKAETLRTKNTPWVVLSES